jgi:hypothetical protein
MAGSLSMPRRSWNCGARIRSAERTIRSVARYSCRSPRPRSPAPPHCQAEQHGSPVLCAVPRQGRCLPSRRKRSGSHGRARHGSPVKRAARRLVPQRGVAREAALLPANWSTSVRAYCGWPAARIGTARARVALNRCLAPPLRTTPAAPPLRHHPCGRPRRGYRVLRLGSTARRRKSPGRSPRCFRDRIQRE